MPRSRTAASRQTPKARSRRAWPAERTGFRTRSRRTTRARKRSSARRCSGRTGDVFPSRSGMTMNTTASATAKSTAFRRTRSCARSLPSPSARRWSASAGARGFTQTSTTSKTGWICPGSPRGSCGLPTTPAAPTSNAGCSRRVRRAALTGSTETWIRMKRFLITRRSRGKTAGTGMKGKRTRIPARKTKARRTGTRQPPAGPVKTRRRRAGSPTRRTARTTPSSSRLTRTTR